MDSLDLQVLQQRGNPPHYVLDQVTESLTQHHQPSQKVFLVGSPGVGKTFACTTLLEEQRSLNLGNSSSSQLCCWVYADLKDRFWLDSLNEALGYHHWRGDSRWVPLSNPAMADIGHQTLRRDHSTQATALPEKVPVQISQADLTQPLNHFLHSLWYRNREMASVQRIVFLLDGLELNGEHPAVVAIKTLFEKNAADPRVEIYARLLYEQAVISEGSKVQDPAGFAKRINELIAKDAATA